MSKTGQQMDTAQLQVRNRRAVRSRHGSPLTEDADLNQTIAELNREMAYLEYLAAQTRKIRKKQEQTWAAIFQTDSEYFRIMCKLMDPLTQICPRHPMVQTWLRVRKMWSEQLLKQN